MGGVSVVERRVKKKKSRKGTNQGPLADMETAYCRHSPCVGCEAREKNLTPRTQTAQHVGTAWPGRTAQDDIWLDVGAVVHMAQCKP